MATYTERTAIWMVTQDGRSIIRGLRTRQQAEAQAKLLAEGSEARVMGSTIRVPCYDVAVDDAAMKKWSDRYTEFRGYRNGGN